MESSRSNLITKCPLIIAIIIISVSLVALIGWTDYISALTHFSTSWTHMKVITTVCFLLSGSALLLLPKKSLGFITYTIIVVITMFILLINSFVIFETITGIDLGINVNPFNAWAQNLAGPTFITALTFFFVACAFLCVLGKQTSGWASQTFAWLILLLSLFSFCNHIYHTDMHYRIAVHMTMSITSSILFALLSLGILLLRPDTGIVAILLRNSPGGFYLRRILPVSLVLPMLFTILENKLERTGLIEPNFGDSIATTGIVLFFGIFLAFIARKVDSEENKLITTQNELLQNEIIFQQFSENVDIVFYRTSLDLSKIFYVSSAYEKIWGKSTESLYKNPMEWFEAIHPEDQKIVYEAFLGDHQGESSASAEYRIKRPDGSIRYIFSRTFRLKDPKNNYFSLIGIAADITEARQQKKYLEGAHDILSIIEHEKKFNDVAPKILRTICEIFDWDFGQIWLIDASNSLLRCVHSWHKKIESMSEYEKINRKNSFKLGEGFPGKVWEEKKSIWILDYSSKEEFSRSEEAGKSQLNSVFGIPIIFQDKIFGVMQFFIHQMINPDKQMQLLLSNVGTLLGEFIQRMHTNEQIQTISRYDILTGLLNRSAFEEKLNGLIVDKNTESIAIIIMDIDRFKMITEALGQDKGDLILKLFSKRLENLIDPSRSIAARLTSNKFILFYCKIKSPEDVLDYAHSLHQCLKESIKIAQNEFHLTMSIGIAIYPQDGADVKTLITNADLAMMNAKKQGGKKSILFTKELPIIASKKLSMHTALHEAIINNQFYLDYQPQIDLLTGHICGVEALVRWQHPIDGLILPTDFITDVEEAGLIIPLNELVLRMVFQQVKSDWSGPPISVNISAQQFKDKHYLVKYLESLIDEFSVDPKHIELEIVESLLMEDIQHNIDDLAMLRHLGFRLAIDDFGTGFSSLNYLYRLPADKIKIDRSFIAGLPRNQMHAIIVKSMIAMLHALGKKVVAEGAETDAEIAFLKQEKCDIVQSYYYYKPMSAEDFIALITGKHIM